MNGPRAMLFALVVTLISMTLSASAVHAQVNRYETGRRLRLFEVAWANTSDADARRRALTPLEQSVTQFLRGRDLEAAQSLDAARFALRMADELPAPVRWAESLMLVPAQRAVDAADEKLTLELRSFYPVTANMPAGATLMLTVLRVDDPRTTSVAIEKLPQTVTLPLTGLGEGDFRLRYSIMSGDMQLAEGECAFSLIKDLRARTAALAQATDGFENDKQSIDKQTARAISTLVTGLSAGDVQETDFPAARLLAEAEAAAQAAKEGKEFYGGPKAGQFWLRLPTAHGVIPARLFVPPRDDDEKPLPLVVALHGAKGSENLFFDGYGQGAVVDECQRRGWMVVSPRTEGFGLLPVDEIVAAVNARYPVDPRKVFVVGHSMGAMQTSAAALAKPELYAAAAALGGGGTAKASAELKKLPYFVAAGSRDFALPGAKQFVKKLQEAGVEQVVFREYPDVEHLLIVQEALGDVFKFFDDAAAKR
jgi:pimeloyl-ACP methyl ester carboxylesterase